MSVLENQSVLGSVQSAASLSSPCSTIKVLNYAINTNTPTSIKKKKKKCKSYLCKSQRTISTPEKTPIAQK